MVLFAAIPPSALIWARNMVVQPLEVADDSRTISGPTTGSAGSTDDGVNPGESRRRERIQADVARRARVIDGDTIEVGSVRIRLFGVDAPESAQSCLVGNRRWSCGEQATRALVGRIDGESVACEERGRDRYGRVVAVCGYGAQDVNAWLVREGSVTFMCRHGRYASRNTGTDQNAAIHLYTHERACPEARSARGRGVSNNARARQRPWISPSLTCPRASGFTSDSYAA